MGKTLRTSGGVIYMDRTRESGRLRECVSPPPVRLPVMDKAYGEHKVRLYGLGRRIVWTALWWIMGAVCGLAWAAVQYGKV